MLRINDLWEVTEDLEVFRNILGQPRMRRYSSCEIPLNCYLFHLDYVEGQPDQCRVRRIFVSTPELLHFLNSNTFADLDLNLLSRRTREQDYAFERVDQIVEGVGPEGMLVHIYRCPTESFIDSLPRIHENEIREKKIIWTARR